MRTGIGGIVEARSGQVLVLLFGRQSVRLDVDVHFLFVDHFDLVHVALEELGGEVVKVGIASGSAVVGGCKLQAQRTEN